ncbi:hypothetical protein DD238_002675 [Peronospora effusa]|uniref:Uncharacterized protein n=1 Tax=Peronospora effusa TaxID=542832 RepID=A0A3M6VGQ8_9STRA|nr:hypothetical protein DD238_002675 [Peronospora effusa]
MYRVRGSAVGSLKSRVASNCNVLYTSLRPWRQDLRLVKHTISFSSESSRRSQVQDNVQTPSVSHFRQGHEAMKITRIGMYVNVAMAGNQRYGKYEAVGSLSVGAILVVCGFGIGADGLEVIQEIWTGNSATNVPEFYLPYLSQLDRSWQWVLAAGAAAVSIAAKEALYRATVKIGQQANSKVLIANAWHHRTDAISSIVALGGIVGSMAGTNAGCFSLVHSVQELTDNTVEAEVLETLEEVSGSVDDVLHVSQVRARRMGPYTLVDLRVHLDARTSISMAQQISERVRSHILNEVPDVSEVLVHIDVQFGQFGCFTNDTSDMSKRDLRPYREIKNDVSYALATIPEITGMTHINTHWVPHQGTVVDVAILVQPDLKVGAVYAVAKKARKSIEAIPYIVEADIHLELQDDDTDV